jgi:hypothetical protein
MISINRSENIEEDAETIFQYVQGGYHGDSIQYIDGSPEIYKIARVDIGLGKLEKVPREIKGRSPPDPFMYQKKKTLKTIAIKEF